MATKTIKLSEIQQKIVNRLAKGDKIGLYPTGDHFGYGEYYRFESDKQVVPSKTFKAMRDKKLITEEHLLKSGYIMNEIIKYNPYN